MICATCAKKATHGSRVEQVPMYCASCAKRYPKGEYRNLSSSDCQFNGCDKYAKYYYDSMGTLKQTTNKNRAMYCKTHADKHKVNEEKKQSPKPIQKESKPKQVKSPESKNIECVEVKPVQINKSSEEEKITKRLILGNWGLGELIGKGAFGSVYEAIPLTKMKNDKIQSFVIKVVEVGKTKQQKRIADTLYHEFVLHNTILHQTEFVPRVPLKGYGEDNKMRYLVMERLGKTFEDKLKSDGPISDEEAVHIGLQLLSFFEFLHSKGRVYVDVKPENFLYAINNDSKVYCTDFGLVESYLLMNKHKQKVKGSVIGTPTYLSLDCHNGFTHARKDDIESLLYVLIYMMKGCLPWQNAKSDDEAIDIKQKTTMRELCKSIDPKWGCIVQHIRKTEFSCEPDYRFIRNAMTNQVTSP